MLRCAIERHDAAHIFLGFIIRRHAGIALYSPFAGVVRGRRHQHVALETPQQPAQVGQAAAHVLLRVHDIAHAEALGRIGNQLHQALRVPGRAGVGIEVGFGAHDGQCQPRIDVVARRQALDQARMTTAFDRQRGDEAFHHFMRHCCSAVGERTGLVRVQAVRQIVADFGHVPAVRKQGLRGHMALARGQRQQVRRTVPLPVHAAVLQQQAAEVELCFGAAVARSSAIALGRQSRQAAALCAVAFFKHAGEYRGLVRPCRRIAARTAAAGKAGHGAQQQHARSQKVDGSMHRGAIAGG